MPTSVMIVCGSCQTSNEVVPRETVSFFGGSIPTFDPPQCRSCRHFLQPTPEEWATMFDILGRYGDGIPAHWWTEYAKRKAPNPSTA